MFLRNTVFALLFAVTFPVSAELVSQPDSNTLWSIEKSSQKNWPGGRIWVKERSQGFSIGDDNPSNQVGHSLYRKVEVNPEYPWLVFEIEKIKAFKGYCTWGLGIRELGNSFGSTSNAESGLVAINCFQNAKSVVPVPNKMSLNAYFYDFEADFKYIKMVRVPENYIEAVCSQPGSSLTTGNRLKFTVHLAAPAEEVTLKLVNKEYLYSVMVNGLENIELAPEDKDQKVWSSEIELRTLSSHNQDEFSKGQVLMRATIFGGAINVPLWGILNYSYKETK